MLWTKKCGPERSPIHHHQTDRDASASIRGYVFQIDRTIDRWLTLSPDQSLGLERGENIDLVSRLLSADGTTEAETRLLEQIKYRGTSVAPDASCPRGAGQLP